MNIKVHVNFNSISQNYGNFQTSLFLSDTLYLGVVMLQ